MAEDWAADVKRFVSDADDKVIAAIVRYCGIALQKRDSSLVSFTDPVETGRVRENFLKKKLGLTQPDDVLDGAIAAVGERMKGSNFKNRVTVYYLLLEHFGLLHMFGGAEPAADVVLDADHDGPGVVPGGAAVAGAAAAGLSAMAAAGGASAEPEPAPPPPIRETVSAAPINPPPPASSVGAAQGLSSTSSAGKGGSKLWLWLLLGLIALGLLWWFFLRGSGKPTAPPAPAEVVAPAIPAPAATGPVDLSTAPAEGAAVIPEGAGVTVETRDGKPVAKVYFETGKADVVPAFTETAAGLKAYLDGHSGSALAVSGFNDKTGNAAANAELSKNRAQAVKAALVSAGIADSAVELVKPSDTTDTSTNNAAARRVEVVVR